MFKDKFTEEKKKYIEHRLSLSKAILHEIAMEYEDDTKLKYYKEEIKSLDELIKTLFS